MSKLYWMEQIIATTDSEYVQFEPGSLSGIQSHTVGGAIREVATTMTGILMSTELSPQTTTFSFTNVNFNDNMYVESYCDKEIDLEQPVYDDSTKTITFECSPVSETARFRIVVKF